MGGPIPQRHHRISTGYRLRMGVLVVAGDADAPMAPHLAGALGHAHGVRRLCEVQLLVEQSYVALAAHLLHVMKPRVLDTLELVSYQSTHLGKLRALQRPLESTRECSIFGDEASE